MSCPKLSYEGSTLLYYGEYICKVTGVKVDEAKQKHLCDDDDCYRQCPIYIDSEK